VLYSVNGSPALTLRGNVLVWDPGDYNENVGRHQQPVPPILGIVGSPCSYALVARAMRRMLKSRQRLASFSEELRFPLTVGAWRRADGTMLVLVCDTEEGFDYSAVTGRWLILEWSADGPAVLRDIRTGESVESSDSLFTLLLNDSKDRLFVS
jgi:hypothetical protein